MFYSLSIHRDKADTLLIIPFALDGRIHRNVNRPVVLEKPYSFRDIGGKVRESFSVAVAESSSPTVDLHIPVFTVATGIKSFSKFSKDRDEVSASYDPERGYWFQAEKRTPKGSYQPDEDKPTLEMNLQGSDEEMGMIIMQLFDTFR